MRYCTGSDRIWFLSETLHAHFNVTLWLYVSHIQAINVWPLNAHSFNNDETTTSVNTDITDPPAAHGPAVFTAMLKVRPEDFRVDEILDIELAGAGEHLYLQIEKTAMNTDEVATLIQECYSVTSSDVGLCGLKDRHSVATQWISVRTAKSAEVFEELVASFNQEQKALWGDTDGYVKAMRVLVSGRHARKLRRGAHGSNRFEITLRDVQVASTSSSDSDEIVDIPTAVAARVDLIATRGFPAYIGAQRFGRGGQNLQRAQRMFATPRKRTSRQQRSLWLSAARSAVFNCVCAARVRDGSWDQLLEGEPAVLNGTRSFFATNAEESLERRLSEFDIHPSAPWWGRGQSLATGASAAFENQQLEPYKSLCAGLEQAGLTQERRALRAPATPIDHQWVAADVLKLQFSLAPGIFATSLLRELCTVSEPAR